MDYAEASYFDGAHFAHIAARDDHLRRLRIEARQRAAQSAPRERYETFAHRSVQFKAGPTAAIERLFSFADE